jgi:hypothetical protein
MLVLSPGYYAGGFLVEAKPDYPTQPVLLPDGLPLLRCRVTLRLLEDTTLPAFKGALLRGGFGYAFQRATCPQACWGRSEQCTVSTICPYRWVFETPHPPDVPHLHDLRDVPRPFVIEPPLDGRTRYAAGDALEFMLILIGRGTDYLPYFLFAFEHLGRMGLGKQRARARLERVEALQPWQPVGQVIYQDERVLPSAEQIASLDSRAIQQRARALPADVRLILRTPLRVKTQGTFIETINLTAVTQAACWRINALATFHGTGPWELDYRPLVEQARQVHVEQEQVRWQDWSRTSTREKRPQKMTLGGILGSAVLREVSLELRTVLLMGSLIHVGKACVFGHGGYAVERVV